MKIITIAETDSTNSELRRRADVLDDMTLLRAESQTAGRGQRGNSWEAAAGENLTFSILHRPEGIEAKEQFAISEAAALGVADYLQSRGIEARVKWPNDIYVGDRKICGILIEHSIAGRNIDRTIAGVGINVNQTQFESDAPNPESMARLTGRNYNLQEEAEVAGRYIEKRLIEASRPEGRARLHGDYMSRLWRGEGIHAFRDPAADERYEGKILEIAPSGELTILNTRTGKPKTYLFKEVEFIL